MTVFVQGWPEGHQLAKQMNFKFPQFEATPLTKLVPNASKDAIYLIEDMLRWNPRHRPNANQSLRYSFFNNIRDREENLANGELIPTQQIAITTQPSQRVSVNVPISYQTVKAEVYEPITKILDSKWERDYYASAASDEFDGNHNQIDNKISRYISGNGYRPAVPQYQQNQPVKSTIFKNESSAKEESRTRFASVSGNKGSGQNRAEGSYSNAQQRGYPSTTYETRRSAFLQASESASKSGSSKQPTALRRIDWAAKYLTYGQS
ncbi:Serine/threonine-protein kinase ICK [Folsomia candida]|uniref:Serine/threonine-protein kinase ICK n=1 Tax=Folsomia candida TaxID=158441 RepID=A0A226F527_FOLCA|nr:Serine/threonine-protein kinase ICK [Folsomia candida]